MDSPTQFLRYGIPGWTLVLVLTSIIASCDVVLGPVRGELDIHFHLGSLAGIAVAAGAAGIPIGFLVYQIYFAAFWFAFYRAKWKLENAVCGGRRGEPCLYCKDDNTYQKIVNIESTNRPVFIVYILAWLTGFSKEEIEEKLRFSAGDQTCWHLFIPAFRRSCINSNKHAIGAYYGLTSIFHALGACTFGIGIGYTLALMSHTGNGRKSLAFRRRL